jgi:predicted adenine nucleotide alpha hydrolase (AANH) superfamily ATPase
MHSCCAPCSTFPLSLMRSMGYSVSSLFVNPNIYRPEESEKRWLALEEFASREKMPVRKVEVGHDKWLEAVSHDLKKPVRCLKCYRVRLDETARIAREEGFPFFTTSLLLSVYQDHEGILREAKEAAREHSVEFLYMDFRKGYRRSREMARGTHLYMQKYCGCEFSLGGLRRR